MKSRILKFTFLMVVILLISFTLSIAPQLELPAPKGPHSVGRTTFKWVDHTRPEVLTEDPSDFREVIALVWYPAEPTAGVSNPYFQNLSSIARALAASGEVEPWQVFGLQFIRSPSSINSPLAGNGSPYPVVLFSPGNGTNVEFYNSLASEIASYGYIVAGINHPYDVAAVELSNGDVAGFNKDQWTLPMREHAAYTAERIQVRTVDVLFALEQLDDLNAESGGVFEGALDTGSVAVAGHSLGGITASEACKAAALLRACLNLDGLQTGGPFSTEETAIPPDQPFMFLTKESQLHPRLIESFESTSTGYWVTIHNASHESFTDGPTLQPSLLPLPDQADRLMALIQKYTLAFLDQSLKGQPSALLTASTDDEDVSIKVFPSR